MKSVREGQRVRVARDNEESAFVRTGACGGIVAEPWVGYNNVKVVLIKVDHVSDLLRDTGWGDRTVAVPMHALEPAGGLLDV